MKSLDGLFLLENIEAFRLKLRAKNPYNSHPLMESVRLQKDWVASAKSCLLGMSECLEKLHESLSTLTKALTEDVQTDQVHVISKQIKEIIFVFYLLEEQYLDLLDKNTSLMTVLAQNKLKLEFESFWNKVDEALQQAKKTCLIAKNRAKMAGILDNPDWFLIKYALETILSFDLEDLKQNIAHDHTFLGDEMDIDQDLPT